MCGYEKKDVYHLSTIFEYIHCASLLHDDVIDNADIRRKKPSASNLWGNTAAVLAGDYMFSMASRIALQSKKLEILGIVTNTAACMTEGQVRELNCTRKWDISEEEYLEIIISKTADLISASCAAGAVIAQAEKEEVENLKNFGLNMGIAFQMVDDLLDYSSSEEEFGKPVGKDFKEGKITLPLIYTITGMTKDESEKFKELLLNGSNSEEDYNELINLVRVSGNIEKTKSRAQEYVATAAEYLKMFPSSELRNNLLSLNEYMIERLY
jgi:octaprenyl-diphosphate synthase